MRPLADLAGADRDAQRAHIAAAIAPSSEPHIELLELDVEDGARDG